MLSTQGSSAQWKEVDRTKPEDAAGPETSLSENQIQATPDNHEYVGTGTTAEIAR